jgi:hypothetical protein
MEQKRDFTPLIPENMRDAIPVYAEAIRLMHSLDIPFIVVGGIPMLEFGRSRVTKDLDLLVYKRDAFRLLDMLKTYGFSTQRTDDNWVYHAFKNNQIIDLLFALGKGFLGNADGIVLNDEIMSRARTGYLGGQEFPLMSPEDLIHSKLLVSWKRERQEDFQDILLIIENAKFLNWDRLMHIISRYPMRTLALLSYTASYQPTEELLPPHILNKIDIYSLSLSEWTERAA